jgi:hypothetical protein
MIRKSTLVLIIVITGLMFYTGCNDGGGEGQALGEAPAPVPQTGQTNCWNAAGSEIACAIARGQDGKIQAGVVPPDPRFTDNGEGQITDNLTGLVWLKNANCPGGERTWQQALDFANGLADGQCGLSDGSRPGDWRLPNRNELRSLLDAEKFDPALPAGNPFVGVQNDSYWTSTTYDVAKLQFVAWNFNMGGGSSTGSGKISGRFVTAVRNPKMEREAPAPVPQTGQTGCWNSSGTGRACSGSGQDGDIRAGVKWPNPRFTDNKDGTITDNLTGLVWLKNMTSFGRHTWEEALRVVDGLASGELGLTDGSVAGDWRLPNVNELASLLDLNNDNPALPGSNPFTDAKNDFYWTSTTAARSPSLAWVVSFVDGSVGGRSKSDMVFLTAVSGAPMMGP